MKYFLFLLVIMFQRSAYSLELPTKDSIFGTKIMVSVNIIREYRYIYKKLWLILST